MGDLNSLLRVPVPVPVPVPVQDSPSQPPAFTNTIRVLHCSQKMITLQHDIKRYYSTIRTTMNISGSRDP
jgi:hypothetical protein